MRIETDREIKGLRSQLSAKRGDLSVAKTSAAASQRLVKTLSNDIRSMEDRIKALESSNATGDIVVTEHAIIRYLERVKGINLDDVKAEILDGAESAIRFMGDGQLRRPSGFSLVIKGRTVVTIK